MQLDGSTTVTHTSQLCTARPDLRSISGRLLMQTGLKVLQHTRGDGQIVRKLLVPRLKLSSAVELVLTVSSFQIPEELIGCHDTSSGGCCARQCSAPGAGAPGCGLGSLWSLKPATASTCLVRGFSLPKAYRTATADHHAAVTDARPGALHHPPSFGSVGSLSLPGSTDTAIAGHCNCGPKDEHQNAEWARILLA